MTTQHKPTGRASTIPAGLAAGAGISICVTILVCLTGAWLISAEILPQKQIGYCVLLALVTATILGAMTAWKKIRRQKLAVCMMSGGVYFVLLALSTTVFFGGDFQGVWATLAAIILGSLAAALLTKERENMKKGKMRLKKMRYTTGN